MSCSQFHSIKLFILRHAWLNLWDKHMTTGRINQVTIVHQSETRRNTNPTGASIAETIVVFHVWLIRTRSRVRSTSLTVVRFPGETNSSTINCSKWLALCKLFSIEIETLLQMNSNIDTRNANGYRFNQFPLFEIRNESANTFLFLRRTVDQTARCKCKSRRTNGRGLRRGAPGTIFYIRSRWFRNS